MNVLRKRVALFDLDKVERSSLEVITSANYHCKLYIKLLTGLDIIIPGNAVD
ncbi:hypothetical protein NIES4075_58130 [Tolypothrix sp. NIES-4075]|nr:hypothetical protein NIES4075_58130 [Tolypothrix sp. NIES-4075]